MKLLIITSLKEYQGDVVQILGQSGISDFNITETIGFKEDKNMNLLDGWFSIGKEHFGTVFFFSFSEEENLEMSLSLIKTYNAQNENQEPVKAFVISIEKSVC